MTTSRRKKGPEGAVAGLAEILKALGNELRQANEKIGEFHVPIEDSDEEEVVPVLFLRDATVEMEVTFTRSSEGGVDVWVLGADARTERATTTKIVVNLNTNGEPFEVGQ